MNLRKTLSVALSFVMISSLVITTAVNAAIVPPKNIMSQNALVKHEKKSVTRNFATSGPWESWLNKTTVVTTLPTGGAQGQGALQFAGGAAKDMVLLDQFGDLRLFDELTFAIKSTKDFSIQFAVRADGADTYSKKVIVPSTGGAWNNVSIPRSAFYEGILTNEQIDAMQTVYDGTLLKYTSVVLMLLGSDEATISDLYAKWYEYIQPVIQTKTSNKFELWGAWGGTVFEQAPGAAEDGVGTALKITGGANGGGTQIAFTGGQLNDVTRFDAYRLRVKSTASFGISMREEFRDSKKPTIDSRGVTFPSTNGEWKDIYVSVEDLKPLVDGDWIYSMKTGGVYYPATKEYIYEPILLMRINGTNFGASNYAIIDHIDALWYSKNPTVESISFASETSTDEGLDAGTTNVNVVLRNSSIQAYTGAVVVAAMYQKATNKLVSVAAKTCDMGIWSSSAQQTLSVTMPDNEILDYEIKVFVWENKEKQSQITEVMTYDAYGASVN